MTFERPTGLQNVRILPFTHSKALQSVLNMRRAFEMYVFYFGFVLIFSYNFLAVLLPGPCEFKQINIGAQALQTHVVSCSSKFCIF